jgi:adenosylmethionine---8-amino-7-oxononanoate aminotransferase
MHSLARLDHQFVWHPFTQMQEWLKREPIVIVSGEGTVLRDVRGREYLDANASIWTNLHGHNHPKINGAITRQLKKIAHSSALGLANEPASMLAAKLASLANAPAPQSEDTFVKQSKPRKTGSSVPTLGKVFYSDDGSTAVEVALKLAYEFARRTGQSPRPKFLSLEGAYHGDTVGAVSLGHIDLFHKRFSGLLFRTDRIMAPYCYRCPFNRAKPERGDARSYRQCAFECVGQVAERFERQRKAGKPYAAFVVEPLIQGAAGMIAQPRGWLQQVSEIVRENGAQLIADEVMTGFGRTGVGKLTGETVLNPPIFACQHENVRPDFMALAKGLTGGYLPMAATLTTEPVFDAFLGDYESFKTFFHGHSYTANQLGAAAALASIQVLQSPAAIRARRRLEAELSSALSRLWEFPNVGDVRQVGLIAGIELVRDWRTRQPFELRERAGQKVCEAMARRGVLTRPIGNVVVLMPPYCTTTRQLRQMVSALRDGLEEVFGSKKV